VRRMRQTVARRWRDLSAIAAGAAAGLLSPIAMGADCPWRLAEIEVGHVEAVAGPDRTKSIRELTEERRGADPHLVGDPKLHTVGHTSFRIQLEIRITTGAEDFRDGQRCAYLATVAVTLRHDVRISIAREVMEKRCLEKVTAHEQRHIEFARMRWPDVDTELERYLEMRAMTIPPMAGDKDDVRRLEQQLSARLVHDMTAWASWKLEQIGEANKAAVDTAEEYGAVDRACRMKAYRARQRG
jgi:hypothetical protein